ncbi:MAG: hypothetical protein PUJ57_00380 [Peptoniphilaceae bacterium]|nr:hypothetical protein [Peptoniphilaceae bacterium]MDY6086273.1 hypothetical protein [Peptoniphilaceae bacterium]
MSNLDNIKEQILLEAKKEIDALEGEMLATLDRERHDAMKEANAEAQRILERAKLEVPLIEERVQAEADRDDRNEKLRKKQELVDAVMHRAEEKLKSLPAQTVVDTLTHYLKTHPLNEGDVVELPKDVTFQTDVGTVKEAADLKRGFRITREGVRENDDFLEVLYYMKDDVEQEVMKALAKGEA